MRARHACRAQEEAVVAVVVVEAAVEQQKRGEMGQALPSLGTNGPEEEDTSSSLPWCVWMPALLHALATSTPACTTTWPK